MTSIFEQIAETRDQLLDQLSVVREAHRALRIAFNWDGSSLERASAREKMASLKKQEHILADEFMEIDFLQRGLAAAGRVEGEMYLVGEAIVAAPQWWHGQMNQAEVAGAMVSAAESLGYKAKYSRVEGNCHVTVWRDKVTASNLDEDN